MTPERAKAIAMTIGILMLMSLGSIFSKLALRSISPLTLTWTSVAVGMIAMTIYTFVLRREPVPRMSRQIWTYIFIIGFFNFVVGRIASTAALSLMPATTNAYLSNFIGFITMGMSILILKESPTIFQVLGALVAVAGLRVFFREIPAPSELLGVVLVLIGITGVAFTNNIARKLAVVTNRSLSNTVVSTLALLIGGSLTVAIGLIFEGPVNFGGPAEWGVILYSGLVGIALGLTVWNQILRVLRSYEASILGASTVIWTALLAVPFLGERLAPHQVTGIALMLGGLILVQVRAGRFSEVGAHMRGLARRARSTP